MARPETGEEQFSIKSPFKADDDSGIIMEHLWLGGIHFRDGVYYGVLANTPLHVSGMSQGDTVAFDIESISDWMFIQDGTIVGGRSIQYLLKQIPENRRSDEQRRMLLMFF